MTTCPGSLQSVRDASPTQMYFFLPASWVGNTHKETDVLPIGDQEEYEQQVSCHYRQLKTRQALIGEELDSGDFPILIGEGGKMRRLWTRLRK